VDPGRWEAARREAEALVRKCEQDRAFARAIRVQVRQDRSQRQLARAAGFTRPRAGLGCIPVVEQAKGVVMFRQRCGPEEAFDLLRLASQRGSVRMHVLAVQLVEHVAASKDGANVTPISLGAIMGLREAGACPPGR
jgi:AmiR/NasT family two-component response regulator